jgi:hypothetical protein
MENISDAKLAELKAKSETTGVNESVLYEREQTYPEFNRQLRLLDKKPDKSDLDALAVQLQKKAEHSDLLALQKLIKTSGDIAEVDLAILEARLKNELSVDLTPIEKGITRSVEELNSRINTLSLSLEKNESKIVPVKTIEKYITDIRSEIHALAELAEKKLQEIRSELCVASRSAENLIEGVRAEATTVVLGMQNVMEYYISFSPITVTDAAATLSKLKVYYLCNPTGAQDLTLPTAFEMNAKRVWIKNISAQTVTIYPDDAAETIDGGPSIQLTNQYEYVELACDGSVWHILSTNL